MKKTLLSIFAICVAMSYTIAQTADEIIAKHIASRGGAEKLREVKSLEISNIMEVRDMEFENTMKIVVGKAMRSDTKIMDNDMIQAYDGAMAWMVRPAMMGGTGDAEPMADEMTKGVKNQTDPFPLLDIAEKGSKIELVGNEKVKGEDCVHIKLNNADGNVTELWLRASDGLIAKILTSSDAQPQELFYTNHQLVDGISFPFAMEMENQMAGTIKMITKKIVINKAFADNEFKMPAK